MNPFWIFPYFRVRRYVSFLLVTFLIHIICFFFSCFLNIFLGSFLSFPFLLSFIRIFFVATLFISPPSATFISPPAVCPLLFFVFSFAHAFSFCSRLPPRIQKYVNVFEPPPQLLPSPLSRNFKWFKAMLLIRLEKKRYLLKTRAI